jgi:hypothetical protein
MWGFSTCVFFYIKEENKMAFSYTIVENIDHTFEEKGNLFGAVRKIRWGDNPTERLEVRKWISNPDGTETCNKGYTFMTEDGPSELTKTLLGMGYGNTKEVLDILQERNDFRKSLNSVLGKGDELFDESTGTLEDDYYDPKSLIGD